MPDFVKCVGLTPVSNQEERPDVMEKLMNIANEMDEIEAKAVKAGFPNR